MFEGLISVLGKLKNLVSVEAGGQRQSAGRDALQAGRDLIYNEQPAAPPRPAWWLRNGAPEVRLTLATNSRTRMSDASDVRFSTEVRGVEVRTSGVTNSHEWQLLEHPNRNNGGMSFHSGMLQYPGDNDTLVEVEVKFWWDDEERRALFRAPAGDVIANNTFGQPTYS